MANQLTSVIQLALNQRFLELSPHGADGLQEELFSFLAGYKQVIAAVYDSQPWDHEIAYFLVCDFEQLKEYQIFFDRLTKQPILDRYANITDIALGVDRKVDHEVKPDGHDYCAFVKLALTDRWFALASQEKQSLMRELIVVIDGWGERIDVRWLDADAWNDSYTDFLLIQFSCLAQYNEFWHEVRNHPYFASAYFRFRGTLLGALKRIELTTLSL